MALAVKDTDISVGAPAAVLALPLEVWVLIAHYAGRDGLRGLAGSSSWVRAVAVVGWETTPGKLLGAQARWKMWGAEGAAAETAGGGSGSGRAAKRRRKDQDLDAPAPASSQPLADTQMQPPEADAAGAEKKQKKAKDTNPDNIARPRHGRYAMWSPTHAGRHAIVASAYLDGERVAVKVPYHTGAGLQKEVEALAKCNALGVGPVLRRREFTAVGESAAAAAPGDDHERAAPPASPAMRLPRAVAIEWIEGVVFVDFLAGATRRLKLWATSCLLQQCFTLDTHGVVKTEMTHPGRHIIVTPHPRPAVRMIDFDRAALNTGATFKNVTQVCQYLSTARLAALLGTDIAGIRQGAKAYKQAPSEDALRGLLACFNPTDV